MLTCPGPLSFGPASRPSHRGGLRFQLTVAQWPALEAEARLSRLGRSGKRSQRARRCGLERRLERTPRRSDGRAIHASGALASTTRTRTRAGPTGCQYVGEAVVVRRRARSREVAGLRGIAPTALGTQDLERQGTCGGRRSRPRVQGDLGCAPTAVRPGRRSSSQRVEACPRRGLRAYAIRPRRRPRLDPRSP